MQTVGGRTGGWSRRAGSGCGPYRWAATVGPASVRVVSPNLLEDFVIPSVMNELALPAVQDIGADSSEKVSVV